MDANKLKVLQDIGYVIRKTRGNCSKFERKGQSTFGTCSIHSYQHLKHTDASRDLSVHEAGYCNQHKWHSYAVGMMHAFADLKEE